MDLVNLFQNNDDKLKMYKENFEVAYIEATKSFYQKRALDYFKDNNISDYLDYVNDKLKKELEDAQHYLDSSSIQMVRYNIKLIFILIKCIHFLVDRLLC